MEKQNS